MQHAMWLRGIIPGIVFKLDMQFGAYSVLLQKQLGYFLQMTEYYFYYVHM